MAELLLDPVAGDAPPIEVLRWAYRRYDRVALVASFQAESAVLIHMAATIVPRPWVVTIDTGRLPPETSAYIDELRAAVEFDLEVVRPEPAEVSAMVARHGVDLFRDSVELRHRCCDVRKVVPLRRALAGADAWITGVRRDQSPTRASTPVVAPDPAHSGIAKIAPLAAWSREDVDAYVALHGLPLHPLYSRGYTSIGCAPCTRPVAAGEGERAGRWWWESSGEPKECGLHWAAGPR